MEALHCRQRFGMGHTFCYRKQTQNGLVQVIPQQIITKCQIRKILRSIITLLKINLFQSALLGWILKKNKFDLNATELAYNSLLDEQFDRKVFQFILMRAYYVKTYLSEQTIGGQIQTQILTIIPQFPHVYKKWVPQKSLKNLTHIEINKIFQEWTATEPQKKKVDYNSLVDKILFLSKTYNVGTSDEPKDKENKKKRKGNQKKQDKQKSSIKEQKDDFSNFIQSNKQSSNVSKIIKCKQKQKDKSFSNPFQSAGKKSLKDPWQDIYKDQANPQGPILRRSSRNLLKSYNLDVNLGMNNSRNDMLASNNSFLLFNSIVNNNTNGNLLELKPTNSFEDLKDSNHK